MERLSMYTPSGKNQKDSSSDFSDLKILQEVSLMEPRSLRLSNSPERCDGCSHFVYAAGRAWNNDGDCGKFRTPVRGEFVCDWYETEDGV